MITDTIYSTVIVRNKGDFVSDGSHALTATGIFFKIGNLQRDIVFELTFQNEQTAQGRRLQDEHALLHVIAD